MADPCVTQPGIRSELAGALHYDQVRPGDAVGAIADYNRRPLLRRPWLVNGNCTRTTSPKSKGIVDVVFGIAPDGRKSRSACGSGSAGQRPLLLTQADEINEIPDLRD